ncbi:MAG: hypothetical protein C0602_07350 [Denitrovibrio sp.]|nr:MAG: hypothetical protein C0602_07350 [Denitrovibrio sp.]
MKTDILNPFVKGLADGADEALHADAKLMKTPSVEPDVGMFLEFLTYTLKPEKILELGCGIGVSTRYMQKGAPYAHITALDYNKSRLDYAHQNCTGIDFVFADVIDFMKRQSEKYDMIFVDSMKKQYPMILYYALKKLKPGGVIVFDDILMYGHVFSQDCEVPDKYIEVVRTLRNFIARVKVEHRHCILPIGSGVLLIYGEK